MHFQQKRSGMGSVGELVEYLNMNRHIFEKQKSNREHMQRIMSMLSHENMEILQQQFQLYPKGLQLPTFIYLMKKLYTPENEISKYYFVSDLIKFFQAIDINGDGHLEWSEFTEYIIENIRRIDKPNYKNKGFQENQVISSAYSKISNQYKINAVVDPGTTNCIKKVIYIARDQRYYLLEAGSNILRIYDRNFSLVDYLQLFGDSPHSFIIDFTFDKANMIFCAIFEGSARFCNLKVLGNVKTCNECEVKKLGNYHKVQYLPLHDYWAFLSKSGELRLSSVAYRSRTVVDYTLIAVLKQHEAMVTEVVEIEEPRYIASASMDGNVKFYSCYLKKSICLDHISDQKSSAINGRQRKGVLGIDYTREFGSYFLSWGFCGAVFVYALQVSVSKGYSGKYKQHGGNLVAARFLRSFPYVLSFDDRLSMRIWDFRKLTTIQVINCEKNFINPSRLQLIPELSEVLVCEKRITQFRAPSLDQKSREINQFHTIFDFRIAPQTNQLFLFTSADVRVYNFVTGALEKVFTRLNETTHDTHITAAEFGYKNRKFFVGDAAGFVREYCSETGEFLQHVEPGEENHCENKAIVRIIFLKEHSLLIVCSLDGRVLIYERDSDSEFQLIRDIRDTHFELTAAEASARYCMLATGSEDGSVNIWNLEKLTLQTMLVLKTRIVNIAFSPVHPIMIVSEESGVISFFYIRPHQDPTLRNKCFLRVVNCDSAGIRRGIRTIGFELIINAYLKRESPLVKGTTAQQHLICVLGNGDGSIELINISEVLDRYNIEQNHQIFTTKKSMKCETHSLKTAMLNERKKVLQAGWSNDGAQEMELRAFGRRARFEGHKDGVERVGLVKESSAVLSTSGHDKRLKVWSLQGELNGAIDFFTFKKTTWRVAEMNFYKKLQAIDTTIYSMKLIENKQLRPDEQEFIRVNLLLNEFMDAHEKQDYLKWVGVLKRFRSRPKHPRPISTPEEDPFDVRDEIEKLDNVNGRAEEEAREAEGDGAAEFNQIYNKLVAKIRSRVQRPELPAIGRREERDESGVEAGVGLEREKEREGVGEFIAVLRKTLKNGQEEEKRCEREFGVVMGRKGKGRKKQCNMLYQSLVEVRRNIEAMQKKSQPRLRKLL